MGSSTTLWGEQRNGSQARRRRKGGHHAKLIEVKRGVSKFARFLTAEERAEKKEINARRKPGFNNAESGLLAGRLKKEGSTVPLFLAGGGGR